jgi:hypothetical protein
MTASDVPLAAACHGVSPVAFGDFSRHDPLEYIDKYQLPVDEQLIIIPTRRTAIYA